MNYDLMNITYKLIKMGWFKNKCSNYLHSLFT